MKPQFVQLPLRPWPIHRKHPLPVLAAQAVPQPQLVRRVAPLERALAARCSSRRGRRRRWNEHPTVVGWQHHCDRTQHRLGTRHLRDRTMGQADH